MRIVVAAVGRLKQARIASLPNVIGSRRQGWTCVGPARPDVIEVRRVRREAERRITEEAIALNGAVPDDAIRSYWTPGVKNASSEAFAQRIRAWRDGGRQPCASSSGEQMAFRWLAR